VFEQVLRMALEAGALQVGRVARDGSKIKANASKHKAMRYGRMREKSQQVRAEVYHLLNHAEATDAQEDARYGVDRRGDDVPADLPRRETRLKRIREAKRALETRAREEAAAKGASEATAKPDDKAQYNLTDPDSRIMKGPDGFVQAYNAHGAVEATLQLIVGHAVTQAGNDKRHLQPMVRTIGQQAGQLPTQLLADSGYCSDENLNALADTSIDGYIATQKQQHGQWRPAGPRGPISSAATRTERMARRLLTKRGSAVYAGRGKPSSNR